MVPPRPLSYQQVEVMSAGILLVLAWFLVSSAYLALFLYAAHLFDKNRRSE